MEYSVCVVYLLIIIVEDNIYIFEDILEDIFIKKNYIYLDGV